MKLSPLLATGLAALLLVVALAAPALLTLEPASGVGPALGDGRRIDLGPGYPARPELAGVPVAVALGGVEGLDPARDALVVVAPRVGFSDADVAAARAFLFGGGRMLVADDGGVGRDLLARLDAGVNITAATVYSPGFRGDRAHLVALSTGALPGLPAEVVLTSPVVVNGGTPLLRAPELAWLDLDNDLRPDLDEPLRAGSLAAAGDAGRGRLYVLGDPDLVGGDEVVTRALLDALAEGGRRVVLDESHHGFSDPMGANALLGGRLGTLASTGILMLTAAVGALVVLAPRLRARPRPRGGLRAKGIDPRTLRETLEELSPE